MPPSIEQICESLAAGRISIQQAVEWLNLHMGMAELRDSFAMAAMQGILSSPNTGETIQVDKVAAAAYTFADAMLAERAKA